LKEQKWAIVFEWIITTALPEDDGMGTMKKYLFNFAWSLNDRKRAVICGSLGVGLGILINRLQGWTWQLSFLLGWILATGSFLILQAIVLVSAAGP
jgi:hypothetical protein